mmetsp:Transcript_69101/g.195804  ORF Transcript_69101/g.195804 Transcript_69101/m.195804 type:complete len:208 (-) Transcript_69101:957-1580(-)
MTGQSCCPRCTRWRSARRGTSGGRHVGQGDARHGPLRVALDQLLVGGHLHKTVRPADDNRVVAHVANLGRMHTRSWRRRTTGPLVPEAEDLGVQAEGLAARQLDADAAEVRVVGDRRESQARVDLLHLDSHGTGQRGDLLLRGPTGPRHEGRARVAALRHARVQRDLEDVVDAEGVCNGPPGAGLPERVVPLPVRQREVAHVLHDSN